MADVFKTLGIDIDLQTAAVCLSIIWMRLLTAFSVIPFLVGKPVPRRIVVGTALVIALYLYPLLKPSDPKSVLPSEWMVLFALYFKEMFIGLAIGLSASLIFYGFEAAGRMVDNQRGASLARVLIPQLGEQGSTSGQFLFQLALVIYLVLGGHLLFLKSFIESYELIPPFSFPNVRPGLFPLMDFLIVLSANVLVMSVQVAAPVIIAILIVDIVLGITNRLAPQINVWELGFNLRGIIGIAALFAILFLFDRYVYDSMRISARNTDIVIELFQGSIPPELKDVETPPELQNIFKFEPTGEEIKKTPWWDKTIRVFSLPSDGNGG